MISEREMKTLAIEFVSFRLHQSGLSLEKSAVALKIRKWRECVLGYCVETRASDFIRFRFYLSSLSLRKGAVALELGKQKKCDLEKCVRNNCE